MGSSKKHKEKDKEREHKHKRKRRSRSRSKERRSRRKDRDEKSEKRVKVKEDQDGARGSERDQPHEAAPVVSNTSGGDASLSIEETNRLRAKLGLKPLDVPGASGGGEQSDKPKEDEDVHAPPENLGEVKKTAALKEKMAVLKQKRLMNQKLSKVKTLGDSDSDPDDISQWVKRSRKMEKEKVLAEKRAKVLEEMDEEFGISDLMEEEFKDKKKGYSSRDLQGLEVQHNINSFKEGRNVILTLKDKGILDENEEDVLVNVNMLDDEVAEKNTENKKKRPDYKPYDEPQYDEYGMLQPKNVLDKYDEDIDGNKAVKKSFQLGSGGQYDAEEDRQMERIRTELRRQGQSLAMPEATIASEYYTAEEVAAKFKKVKKKVRKIRKKGALKADDLLPLVDEQVSTENFGSRSRGRSELIPPPPPPADDSNFQPAAVIDYGHGDGDPSVIDYAHGIKQEPVVKTEPGFEDVRVKLDPAALDRIKAERMDVDDYDDIMGPDEDLTGVVVDDEEVENELHSALNKARKLKLKKNSNAQEKIAEEVMSRQQVDMEEDGEEEEEKGAQIVMNSVSEFCRNLGEIPTYGLSGNREEEREEIMDTELELMEQKRRQEEIEEAASGWNEVDIDTAPVDILGEEKAVLEEEPIVTDGVGAALALAMKKGYLEKEVVKMKSAPLHSDLAAQYYSIEDKRYDDLDEKFRKRDRYSGGVITDFRDKDNYKPDVKLEYVDESGRNLNPKEAFRQLSHRFHGKGSGKKKTEKRMKKLEEEQLMKQMSSTDTPLNTLSLLQDKQKAEKSAFVILSGNKGLTAGTNITKP